MNRWQDCHGDEDELCDDRHEAYVLREERRAEEALEMEWEEMQREIKKLESMFRGDQCGYLAAKAQIYINDGMFHKLNADEKECWLIENTNDASIKPINWEDI